MISRRALPAVGLAVAFGAAGCAQVPKPISATPPARPAVDAKDVPAILKRYDDVYAKAAKKYDYAALSEIQGNPLREATVEHFQARQRFKVEPDGDLTGDADVFSGPADGYPRMFLAVSDIEVDGKDHRAVSVNRRESSTDSWRRHYKVNVPVKEMPNLMTDAADLVQFLPQNSKDVKRSPKSVIEVVTQVMNKPSLPVSKELGQTDKWKQIQEEVKRIGGKRSNSTVTTTVVGRPGPVALLVDGGIVVFAAVDVTVSRRMNENWYFYYQKGDPYYGYYKGKYASSISKYRWQVIVKQADNGKLSVIGADQTWTRFEATPFT